MFINGDGNWVDKLKDAFVKYKNKITTVDASNNPIKLNTLLVLRILRVNLAMPNPNLKSLIMSGMLTNVTFSFKDTLLMGIENCLK